MIVDRVRAAIAACLLTMAGGWIDAWTYVGHGHVFAGAQTGNIVLAAVALADGNAAAALRHAPSFMAFTVGIIVSRLSAAWLKRRGRNSRTIRLGVEAAALALLALVAGRLGDTLVTALVGFLVAIQITTLSHIGAWSFNTGMTTGNLRGALSAASASLLVPGEPMRQWQTVMLGSMSFSFALGAVAGAVAASNWGDMVLFGAAALVGSAMITARHVPDPVP